MTTNGEEQSRSPLFQRIKAQNVLSFGPDGIDLELGPLNVLIGPNGSGKSNLLELFGLLQAAPREVSSPIQNGGGIHHWIWKGDPKRSSQIEAEVSTPYRRQYLEHKLELGSIDQSFRLISEWIYRHSDGGVEVILQPTAEGLVAIKASGIDGQPSQFFNISRSDSALSQLKGPGIFIEFEYLNEAYTDLRLYRDWNFGTDAVFRQPQRTDVPRFPLNEDFSNLGMFLNRLQQSAKAEKTLIDKLRDLYEGLTHFTLNFDGGTVQVYFHEDGQTIPGIRLSDGSLKYLCLLAILLDPEPPRFIAIEEPELGIHPDLMPQIVDLLVDASRRTQLVVTTHNDTIVDALNDRPEAVVVCEKHDGQTEFKRLDRAELSHWLEKYRLGELWTKGAIGGTRW